MQGLPICEERRVVYAYRRGRSEVSKTFTYTEGEAILKVEDLECAAGCGKPLIGRVVAVIPDQEYHEEPIDETPALMHGNCYLEVFNQIFTQEKRAGFSIVIAPVFDLWAGLFTDNDAEAGVPEG